MRSLFPYVAETAGIAVRVSVTYLAEQSDPARERWFWTYHVRIENGSRGSIQLLTRHWTITDARGGVAEVRGEGVVGDQPMIEPGESYDYVSGCPLSTPTGGMVGDYGVVGEDGRGFDVAIPAFPLIAPTNAR